MTTNTGRSADVAVIGGGIVGVATALQLQRTGRSVVVIERGIPGDEASGHNGGLFSGDCMPVGTPGVIRSLPTLLRDPESALVLRWRYVPRLAPWLIRFALASRASRVEQISTDLFTLMSRGFDAFRPLVAGTPAQDVIEQRAFVSGYKDRAVFDASSYAYGLRKRRGVAFEVVDGARMAELDPLFAGRFSMGVIFPNAFWTRDPGAFTRALLDDLVKKGGAVRKAEVKELVRQNGRVTQLRTTDGDVSARDFVIAAGPWSRTLLKQLGTDLPLEVERGYGADLPAPGIRLQVPVVFEDYHVSMTPHRTGVRITGIDELASIEAPADMRIPQRIVTAAKKIFPELRTEGANLWMRRRPSFPDSLPVIGRAPKSENTWLAFGHAHKGLCMAAITGKLVAELMDEKPTSVDVTPYRPTRFS
jgi:glycine/D-amino acid oxidase-like deaminating enzyme